MENKKFIIALEVSYDFYLSTGMGIPEGESVVGYVSLPDPDPEMSDEELYQNSLFIRNDIICANSFEFKELGNLEEILSKIDSLEPKDIIKVIIVFVDHLPPKRTKTNLKVTK